MIKKDIFGKGERALIDRRNEVFPLSPDGNAATRAEREVFQRYHEAYLDEYFFILRKIFHTFAFDMKEFAVDIHEVPVNEFIRGLTWLTYVQTIIYEMDINTEQLGRNAATMDLEAVGCKIIRFLEEHNLGDRKIEGCVGRVVQYLRKEQDELHGKAEYSVTEIFDILDLKSADLELLRRLLMKVCNIEENPREMEIFKLIDKIREVFDDIRDYYEDLEIANFNSVVFLQKVSGMERGSRFLMDHLESEIEKVAGMIRNIEPSRMKKFQAVFNRLAAEKKYYLDLLDELPRA